MNIIKRSSLTLLVAILILSNLLVVFPVKVSAADSASELAKKEYEAVVAWGVLMHCSGRSFPIIRKDEYNKVKWTNEALNINVGGIWSGPLDVNCADTSDMTKVVTSLGFESILDFNESVAPRSGDLSTCRGKDECSFIDGWTSIVASRMKDYGAVGADNVSYKLSNAGRYYYWFRAFDKLCTGALSNNKEEFDKRTTDKSSLGPYFMVNKRGEVEERKYAFFSVPQNKEVETLGMNYDSVPDKPVISNSGSISSSPSFEAVNCADVAKHLKNRALADGYKALVDQLKGDCTENCDTESIVGDIVATPEGEGENSESCEERMKLSAGWIICSGLELLSSGMDSLLGFIDDLLNVDVIKLDSSSNSELYQSWSYFRAIATFMLVAIGMIMVIGQAIGGGQ